MKTFMFFPTIGPKVFQNWLCQGAAKGVRQKGVRSFFFVFGMLSVTFRSLFLLFLSLFSSLFCHTPFAGLLLRQGDYVLCNPWSHKPMSLNGCLGNSEIGGCKEIRPPFAKPSPTLCQPFANLSPTFRQPFANLFCQPFLPTPLQPPLSVDSRHWFRDTG